MQDKLKKTNRNLIKKGASIAAIAAIAAIFATAIVSKDLLYFYSALKANSTNNKKDISKLYSNYTDICTVKDDYRQYQFFYEEGPSAFEIVKSYTYNLAKSVIDNENDQEIVKKLLNDWALATNKELIAELPALRYRKPMDIRFDVPCIDVEPLQKQLDYVQEEINHRLSKSWSPLSKANVKTTYINMMTTP